MFTGCQSIITNIRSKGIQFGVKQIAYSNDCALILTIISVDRLKMSLGTNSD